MRAMTGGSCAATGPASDDDAEDTDTKSDKPGETPDGLDDIRSQLAAMQAELLRMQKGGKS